MRYFLLALIAIMSLTACNRPELVRAKIFERKEIAENELMISYHYMINNKLYTDSATIKNKVISTDSINVIVDPKKPGKAIPDIKE